MDGLVNCVRRERRKCYYAEKRKRKKTISSLREWVYNNNITIMEN